MFVEINCMQIVCYYDPRPLGNNVKSHVYTPIYIRGARTKRNRALLRVLKARLSFLLEDELSVSRMTRAAAAAGKCIFKRATRGYVYCTRCSFNGSGGTLEQLECARTRVCISSRMRAVAAAEERYAIVKQRAGSSRARAPTISQYIFSLT